MGVASRSRTAFRPAEVSLERDSALPVSSQSATPAPSSARVFNVDEEDVFLDDMGVHSRGGVSRVRVPHLADDELVSWCGRRVRACELFSRCELNSGVRGRQSILFENGSQPTAGDPELTEDVALDSFACNSEDHLVTHRGESDTTAVKLAVVHHEFAVDPLRRFFVFAMDNHWHSSNAVY